MIVVTGATGKLGTLVLGSLLKRVPAEQVGVSVRDLQKADAFREQGVRVRQGDFSKPESLAHAFEGVSKLLVISSNAAAYGDDPLAQHRAAIESAKRAGVQRIFYTSHMAASLSSAFPPMTSHATTEGMLAASGVAWTSLRNGFYAEAALQFMGPRWQDGEIVAPADGKVAWTTHGDLAEAAASLLAGTDIYEGPTPPLVASEGLDLADLASLGASLLGHPVHRRVVEDDAFYEAMVQRGLPPHVAKLTVGFYEASRRGEFMADDSTLERLIGHDSIRMRAVLARSIPKPA